MARYCENHKALDFLAKIEATKIKIFQVVTKAFSDDLFSLKLSFFTYVAS